MLAAAQSDSPKDIQSGRNGLIGMSDLEVEMKKLTLFAGVATVACAVSTAGFAASCNPNSASQYAPGQQAKQTGQPANTFAPGQQAKATGQPANTFAPGQVKKNSTSPAAGCT